MFALVLYIIALFFLGIGNAAVVYHILRYRDPDDISLNVLIAYFVIVFIILIATVFAINWRDLFVPVNTSFN